MISFLSGTHLRTLPNGLILNVAGVGYNVETPLSTLSSISSEGEPLELYIHTHVREDSLRLFGFVTLDEQVVFGLLLSMSGVGPKVALAMLSTLGIEGIYRAAATEEAASLTTVPGIGPRLAEKIIVELKPKLTKLKNPIELPREFALEAQFMQKSGSEPENPAFSDLEDGLINLGFKPKVIQPLIASLKESMPKGGLQDLLKIALKELTGGGGKSEGKVKSSASQDLGAIF